MSLICNGILYTDQMIEAMSLDQIRELAFAESAEQERIAAEKAAPATKTPVTEVNKSIIQDSLAANIPLAKLKAMAEAETMEEIRQAELAAKQQHIAEDDLDKKFENVRTEDIPGLLAAEKDRLAVAESPEGQVEQAANDAEARLRDATYVAEQIERSNSKQLDDVVAKKVQENQNWNAQQSQIALNFVASHPRFIQCPENKAVMDQFLESSGYKFYTEQNLELAFSVLSSRNQLRLHSEKEVEQQNQIREQIVNPKPQRKSSSVSASQSGNLYQKPAALTEDEMYALPLDEIRRRAEREAGQTDPTYSVGGRLS